MTDFDLDERERHDHVHQLRSESCRGSPVCLAAVYLDQIDRERRAAADLETALRAEAHRLWAELESARGAGDVVAAQLDDAEAALTEARAVLDGQIPAEARAWITEAENLLLDIINARCPTPDPTGPPTNPLSFIPTPETPGRHLLARADQLVSRSVNIDIDLTGAGRRILAEVAALRGDNASRRELLQACEARLRAEAETIAGLTVQRDIARESLQVLGTRLQAWPAVLRWHWPDLAAAYDTVARRSGLVVVCQCGVSSEPATAKAAVTAWWVEHVCAVVRGEGPALDDQAPAGHTQDVASALATRVDDLETALEAERVELANALAKVAELERHADILVELRRSELDWARRQRDSERERGDRLQEELDAVGRHANRVAAVVTAAQEWRRVWSAPTHNRLHEAIDALVKREEDHSGERRE